MSIWLVALASAGGLAGEVDAEGAGDFEDKTELIIERET